MFCDVKRARDSWNRLADCAVSVATPYRTTSMSSRSPGARRRARTPRRIGGGCILALTISAVVGGGCASTGATVRSGVGDSFPFHPPYYAGRRVTAVGRVGYFPITFPREGTGDEGLDPKSQADTPLGALIAEMNRFVDSLGVATPLAVNLVVPGTPPDVEFGCIRTTSMYECDERDAEGARAGGDRRTLRLAIGRPSDDWTTWAARAMDGAGVPNALSITIEISDYYAEQTGLVGHRKVELGTGYAVSIPWMTGVDTPVSVLQLTGALMDSSGSAVRIGAEGLVARRSGIIAGEVGVQRVITDDDIAQLRSARRTDLPGQPLVWQVALRNLLAELTGHRELAMR